METILVVDDNRENLKLFQLLLTHQGYTIRTAESGEGALAELALDVPDAILTDVQMPGMDGLQLTRQIRLDPQKQDLWIVAVSANAMTEHIDEAYRAGCNGYITKPIDTRTFGNTVREHLDRAASQEARLGAPPEGGVPGRVR
jgi:two-component system, cell cycle response regulator DivK